MKNLDTLNLLCNKIKESGTPAQIKQLGTNYKAIWWNRQYYCDPEGRPFVCYANEGQAAINQDRPDTSVKDEEGNPAKDEAGTVINNPDNSTNIDLSDMTITLPNGDVQVADAVIYDESTKTYYIDSHDTYNTSITYNYSWTYHINYTSVTYIGQIEQYDKYYEVYYELPDGRDSADLSPQELEQLNLNMDVVNYGRTADDTSLRALYHFDGDTKDSSYWNYCSNFTWNYGASLTYMDAGAFKGALYLDEGNHSFSMSLPSIIGSDDFFMSFRYYQSATKAPVTDSYITVGGARVLQFDGRLLRFTENYGANFPIGSWNEIALVRSGTSLLYYLNGVRIGSSSVPNVLSGSVDFHFGSSQQTYKYLDEFRFVNKQIFDWYSSNYTCPSVPYDTNLVLVLPDSSLTPVADDYFKWVASPDLKKTFDFCQSFSLPFYYANGEPQGQYCFGRCSSSPMTITPSSGGTLFQPDYNGWAILFQPNLLGLGPGQYKMVVYGPDCQPHIIHFMLDGYGYLNDFNSGDSFVNANRSTSVRGQMVLGFPSKQSCIITRIDILPETGVLSTFEKVTSVTAMTDVEKLTLAVKSDIDITQHQIGGVRPSLPKKGLVWTFVEGGFIRSIQIYNGQAWENCEGRIFTGKRWVPFSSYNIITMKDMYDVVDASGSNYEYIYTESGFWNWWQKSWNNFTNRLFSALESAGLDTGGSGTGSGSTNKSLWQRLKDAFNNSLGALIETLFILVEDVLKALLSLVTDMLSFFFGFLTDTVLGAVKAFFGAFKDNSLFDFFQQPPVIGSDGTETDGGYGLPSEVGTAFTFISGVIMVLPPDIRSILFFGLGILVLLGVFKLVKA